MVSRLSGGFGLQSRRRRAFCEDDRMEHLDDLRAAIDALKFHSGRVEEHHGDALTDFGRRLAAIETHHGGALEELGKQIQVLKTLVGRMLPEQPAARTEGFDSSGLPPGSFLGDVPGRYGSEFSRYLALGGLFDPGANTIRYGRGDYVRFYTLSMIFDLIQKENIEGDVVELGVYHGDTAALIAPRARALNKTSYFLDTYEGFDDRDLAADDAHLSGRFNQASLEAVKARVGTERSEFIKGYFPESASQLPADGRYSLAHIDVDLYAPILAGLEYFYPRVVTGGFLVIHDYMSLCWEGAIRAVDEFFADKPEFIVPIPDLAGTVVVRKCGKA
jgi:O-methyltransferase